MVAVGSGGFWGQGIHGATQVKFRYLPGASTDFAFAVFSEEWGFFGAMSLIFLNVLIIGFGFETAMTASDPKGFYLAAGLTGIFGISFLINAGMVVGVLPVVGIPMPFMSYGGSALLMTMVGLALILNVRLRDCG
jgi:rod shape determining protein RodA